MRRWFALSCLAVTLVALAGNFIPAKALVARMPSTPEKVVAADCIVAGKIVAIEEKEVEASQFPGLPTKASYKVVSLKVEESLLGAKGLTHVRVGFVPTSQPSGDPPRPVRPIRPIRPGFNPELKVGREGCFFLVRHHETDFYVVPQFAAQLEKKTDGYEKQVEFIRKSVKLLQDPMTSLKAKDADDRFLTATLLLQKYATARPKMKRVPISAEESKLILSAILDADWTKNQDYFLAPMGAFQRLGLQPKDGFTYPQAKPGQDFNLVLQQAAKAWLKENLDKYRLQKYVEEQKK